MSAAVISRAKEDVATWLERAAADASKAFNHGYVTDLATGLADHLFLQLASEHFTAAELANVVADVTSGLVQIVADKFALFGLWDRRLFQGYLLNAVQSFLDRFEALLETIGWYGGAA
jgi:hypothetical protein